MRNHYKLYLSVHRVPLIRIITISGLTAYSGGQYTQRKINEAKQNENEIIVHKGNHRPEQPAFVFNSSPKTMRNRKKNPKNPSKKKKKKKKSFDKGKKNIFRLLEKILQQVN